MLGFRRLASSVVHTRRLSVAATHCNAVQPAEFAEWLRPFTAELQASTAPLVVAVSGGPDSLALTLLLDEWAKHNNRSVQAVTIDHHLRPESSTEAAQVGAVLADRKIAHQVLELNWPQGPPSRSKLQTMARDMRYDLLAAKCSSLGSQAIFAGHHLNDQAETLLLRWGRNSGLNGWACMPPVSTARVAPKLQVLRPLLHVPKDRLVATCARFGVNPVQDPSNFSTVFDRVRCRQSLDTIINDPASGITLDDVHQVIKHMQGHAAAIQQQEQGILRDFVEFDTDHGFAFIDVTEASPFGSPSFESTRLWSRVIQCFGGIGHPPRSVVPQQLMKHIATREPFVFAGGNCLIQTAPRPFTNNRYRTPHVPDVGRVLICRERPSQRFKANVSLFSVQQPIQLDVPIHWDGRFVLHLKAKHSSVAATLPPLHVLSLSHGLLDVIMTQNRVVKRLNPIPRAARFGLPVICREPTPVEAAAEEAAGQSNNRLQLIANRVVLIPHARWSAIPGLLAESTFHTADMLQFEGTSVPTFGKRPLSVA